MGLKPDLFISKPMDLREKIEKKIVNSFVEKIVKINKVLKNQMVFVQVAYKHYANVHK